MVSMDLSKYYDRVEQRPLTAEDGCVWSDWLAGAKARFGVHPRGFPVFVPADRLDSSNEYEAGDPYSVAEHLDSAFQQRRFQTTLNLLTGVFPNSGEGLRILDLGCGEGHITEAIRCKWPRAELCGFDYSLTAIEIARQRYPSIDFAVADAYDIPYGPATIDATVMNNLWEHLPDPMRLLDQIRRVLKPGGYVIISTPSRYRFENLVRAAFGQPIAFMSKHHVTEYTVGQVVEQMRFGGFEVIARESSRITSEGWSWKWRAGKAALGWWLRRAHSHHSLESTVFYLARKV
jgi:SAM-dependent methyltransferase